MIPVTHASGGPLKDIVVPFNGKPTGENRCDVNFVELSNSPD